MTPSSTKQLGVTLLAILLLLLLLATMMHSSPILHLKSLHVASQGTSKSTTKFSQLQQQPPHRTLPNVINHLLSQRQLMHNNNLVVVENGDVGHQVNQLKQQQKWKQPKAFIVSFQSDTVFSQEFLSMFHSVSQGVELRDYLPQHSFVVQASDYQMSLIAHLDQLEQIAEYTPELKICPTISEKSSDEPENGHDDVDDAESSSTMAQWLEASLQGNWEKANVLKDQVLNANKNQPMNRRSKLQKQDKKQPEWDTLILKLFQSNKNSADVNSDSVMMSKFRSLLDEQKVKYASFAKTSRSTVILVVKSDQSFVAARLLSQYPEIQWIEKDLEEEVQPDMKHVPWVMQSGKKDSVPLTNVGLTGKGQVIGVSDTGLDTNSCYFYDADHPVPFYEDYNERIPHKTSPHRSIEMYYAFLDKLDAKDGHGTHVCSIASGSYRSSVSANSSLMQQYNGIAPESKIAFFDVGCHNPKGCNCTTNTPEGVCPCKPDAPCPYEKLNLPTDLRSGYFSKAYEAGARIHSSSLGGTIGFPYNDKSIAIDEFMYENDDFLVVWSAGNSGAEGGFMTLTGSYKQAKNNIVVGASTSPNDSWKDKYDIYEDYAALLYNSKLELFSLLQCGCNPGTHDLCMSIAAMEGDCCSLMNNCKLDISLQSKVFPNLPVDCCKKCNLQQLRGSVTRLKYDYQSTAGLSSLGPAMDGRLKPDVVAPGYYINAARSHGANTTLSCPVANSPDPNFHLVYKAGTSMATPVIAGTAALVRQYFEEGRYTLNKVGVSINPSAALVKACIIASARPLIDYAQNKQKILNLVPSVRRMYEGFGLPSLINVLPLNQDLNMFFKDRQPIAQGFEHVYTFKYTPQQLHDFTATLVWTDKPGSSFSSVALVNDLDLFVEFLDAESGKKVSIWGNSWDDSSNRPDHLNNVEKIHFDKSLSTSHLTIKVMGHLVPSGSQNYSLVVTGSYFSAEEAVNSLTEREYNKNTPTPGPDPSKPKETTIPIWVVVVMLSIIALLVILTVALAIVTIRTVTKGSPKYARMGAGTEMKEQFIDETQYYQ